LACGLEAPPELLERDVGGFVVCPACGEGTEVLEFFDDDPDGAEPLR
jgi:hypothetical protein